MLGHTWAVQLLQRHIQQGSLRHAYLITGPQGSGRRTLALRLAQALNCPQPVAPAEPCLVCSTCTRIEKMQYSDLSLVQAETQGGTMRVDKIRAVQHSLSLAPYEGRYRTALFLRFEEANPSAANALLKTLEEPPANVVLILTAENPEQLLPTIVSRCEVLRLRPVPFATVQQGLVERWGIPAANAGLLAHISSGRPGFALLLHAQPERLAQRQAWLDEHRQLLPKSRLERFAYAEKFAKNKDQMRLALQSWVTYWRDVLLQASQAPVELVNIDRQTEIEQLANRVTLATAHGMVASIERTIEGLDKNLNPRLSAEILMLDLPKVTLPA